MYTTRYNWFVYTKYLYTFPINFSDENFLESINNHICYSNTKWDIVLPKIEIYILLHVFKCFFISFFLTRTYRGRVYYNRHLFTQAAEDFSFAIHLDPNNWLALYYRACLFRKTNPLRALQDYSVSGTFSYNLHIYGSFYWGNIGLQNYYMFHMYSF